MSTFKPDVCKLFCIIKHINSKYVLFVGKTDFDLILFVVISIVFYLISGNRPNRNLSNVEILTF